ncbi:MAG: transglutaminase-like domain-containing protein [Candidatus Hydrothermia bacterium]
MKIAEKEGVGPWARFVWKYSSEIDRKSFTYENFVLNLKAIKENLARLPWKDSIPENYIYHFVIPIRSTQEPLEPFYHIYKDTLYELVKDCKSMKEAILRINEWCFTKVEYRPTDPWDQSAISTIKRGFGRCEEMSILFMKALRTVGIPVRYVYSPWWPFTESNHAWVEVWTSDGWHFLGAAEPTDFDFAWFRIPSKRAALVLCSAFGNYRGDRTEIMKRYGNHTVLNLTKNYTDPFLLRVNVVDQNGQKVKNAVVSFCVWNYSAFVPVWYDTLFKGYREYVFGRTDLCVMVRKGKLGAFTIVKPDRDTITITLSLDRFSFPDNSFWFRTLKVTRDTTKPYYIPNMDSLISLREEHFKFLKFPYSDSIKGDSVLLRIFRDAKGNWPILWEFYRSLDSTLREKFRDYLKYFEAKDLVMLDTSGLRNELLFLDSMPYFSNIPPELSDSFVLPPRIFREEFCLYKAFLFNKFSRYSMNSSLEDFTESVIGWVRRNVKISKKRYFFKPFQNALQTLSLMEGSEAEVYVLIASILRTFGIPVTSYDAVEFWAGRWKKFTLSSENRILAKFPVRVQFVSNGQNVTSSMNYYYNYSIVRFDDIPMRLDLEPVYQDSHQLLYLEGGEYCLLYGFRNAVGDVFVKVRNIKVEENKDTTIFIMDVSIPLSDLREGDLVVRDFDINVFKYLRLDEVDISKRVFLAIVDFSSEISVTSLNSAIEELRKFDGKVVVLAKNPNLAREYFSSKGVSSLTIIGLKDEILNKMGNPVIPSFIYLNNGRVVFYVEGLVLNLGSLLGHFH